MSCKRAYYYEYILGLKPRATRKAMADGAIIHEMLKAGYEKWNKNESRELWLDRAETWACANLPEDGQLLWDVVKYYYEKVVVNEYFDEVLIADEEGWLDFEGHQIRTTIDLLATRGDRLELIDHKTTGESVKQAMDFLALDFQLLLYSLFVEQEFRGRDIDVFYNVIRRAVPVELTKTGRVSKASKDPSDYLRRTQVTSTPAKRKAFANDLSMILHDMSHRERARRLDDEDMYYRSPRKGAIGCNTCAYKSICERELSGRAINVKDAGIALQFTIAEDPLAKT